MKKIFFIVFFAFFFIFLYTNIFAQGENSVWCDSLCNTTGINCDPGYTVPSECQNLPQDCCYTLYPGGNCPRFIPCVSALGTPTPTPTLRPSPTPTPTSSAGPGSCPRPPNFHCTYSSGICHVDFTTTPCAPGFEWNESVCRQHDDNQWDCGRQYNNCCIETTPNQGYNCHGPTTGCIPCPDPDNCEYDGGTTEENYDNCYAACTGQVPTRFRCENGQCIEDQNGPYKNLGDCEASCLGIDIYGDCDKDKGEIDTAIGCIPTKNASAFIKWFLGRAVLMAGGIAFLMMIAGAFLVIVSSGNPEKVKAGSQLISSAIAGLVFIIFSLFLLRLIGIELLQIPGL